MKTNKKIVWRKLYSKPTLDIIGHVSVVTQKSGAMTDNGSNQHTAKAPATTGEPGNG